VESEPQPVVVLTERQTRVLWLESMGYTREGIARETGWALSNVKSLCQRVHRNLRASTAAQAVRIGLLDGHIGPYEDCGSLVAYRRHIKQDEPTCPACKRGNKDRMDTEALLRSQQQLGEPHIRLLRAMYAGRSNLQIRHAWNINERTLTKLITSTYTLLGVIHYAPSVRREAAIRAAAQRGLLGTQRPTPPPTDKAPVRLSETHVRILAELAGGASIAEAARHLGIVPGTCSTRLSEAYQRLGVSWMDKAQRRPEAIRRAREMGLLPEPASA
jgi:DNA-binding NarL/FixJ family response regulator